MPTSAPGSSSGGRPHSHAVRAALQRGFTLIEMLVVVAIVAIAGAGATLALRDGASTRLEREAQRLAALLESARAQSRSRGLPVRWVPVEGGFRFAGLPPKALPEQWLDADTRVQGGTVLVLGPEPIIGPQAVVIAAGERSLRIATDGLRPFAVAADAP